MCTACNLGTSHRWLVSESVPLMNSDESRRSGGAYGHLGTRQERTEALRTLA